MNELRFAARRLRRSPGFALTAVFVLAIGIGLNTAIFSVVDAVVFRPLPFPDSGRIVRVVESLKIFGEVSSAYANFLDWRRDAKSLSAASHVKPEDVTFSDRGVAERLPVLAVSYGFFDVMGIHPSIGRGFLPQEDEKGAGGRVILTDQLWRRRFGARKQIIGKSINLQGASYTVIGVLPPSFSFPYLKCDALIDVGPTADRNRGNHTGEAIARLRPGVTLAQADAELQAIGKRLEKQYPDHNAGFSLGVTTLQQYFTRDYRPIMLTLLAAVGLVLLIACVNLASLMLVRAAARRRELAVRTALGAGAWDIVRGTLSESLLISLAGGVFGIVLGAWTVGMLLSLLPADVLLPKVSLDPRVLAFAIFTTVFSGMIFGLIPALRSAVSDPAEALKESGRANSAGMHGSRTRNALVVAEIALALVLSMGAGLVVKSFQNLIHVDPGFNPSRVLTMRIALTGSRYEKDDQTIRFWDQFLIAAGRQPPVGKVGLVSFLPMGGNDTQSGYSIEGRPLPKTMDDYSFADNFSVGGDYFAAMGVHLLRGRVFGPGDRENSPRVVVIDEEFARKDFPNDDPLRHRLLYDGKPVQIVGVVQHVKAYGPDGATREQFYFPYAQNSRDDMTVASLPAGPSSSAIAGVRAAVHELDPEVPVYAVRPMESWIDESTWRSRMSTLLLSVFAGVALVLAGIGIYGVLAYSVAQRTQEIGIRLALGATSANILGLVLRQATLLSAIGIIAGAITVLPVTGLLKSILFNVSPADIGVFAIIASILAITGLVAGSIPALRASHTDPLGAIRHE